MFEGTKIPNMSRTLQSVACLKVLQNFCGICASDGLRHREVLPKGSPTTSIEVLRSLPTLGAADVVLGGCLSDMAGHFSFSGLPCLTYQLPKTKAPKCWFCVAPCGQSGTLTQHKSCLPSAFSFKYWPILLESCSVALLSACALSKWKCTARQTNDTWVRQLTRCNQTTIQDCQDMLIKSASWFEKLEMEMSATQRTRSLVARPMR